MKQAPFLLVAVGTIAALVFLIAPAPGRADGEPAPIFVTEIPQDTATGRGSHRPMKRATSKV